MKVTDVVFVDKDILNGIPVFKDTRVPVKNLFAEKMLTETLVGKEVFPKKKHFRFQRYIKVD